MKRDIGRKWRFKYNASMRFFRILNLLCGFLFGDRYFGDDDTDRRGTTVVIELPFGQVFSFLKAF